MRLRITAAATGPLRVNSYLVACEDSGEALLIDPGGASPELSAQLRQEGWRLRWIVNTHGHADHIAGNDLWAAATGARIVIHRLDWEFFRTPAMQAAARAEGFPPLTRADVLVDDGHLIPLGACQALVLHTPGHSPGSMVLLLDGYAFTGDTLFVEAVGRTDFPGGSGEVMFDSIQKKL
ncbi:MAG: MBL fold metallo-hydrolase, partial [Deltaproteobacteria bacterium]|nr:MBL fold metallo-hydrolase [Deltaproteobacteria bacterium]